MRIVGIGVCGPNEKYLEATLNEFKRLCDDVIIVTNNADSQTIQKIKRFGFWTYSDNREWGVQQPGIKTDLLIRANHLRPDWIIALDMDEVFAPEFSREMAEKLASQKEVAWYFLIVNLYNDKDHFAHDVGIQRFWNIRFYKFLPQFGYQFQRKNLHCGLAPPFAYKYGWHASYYVEHYGLMLPEDRERKAARYDRYDPGAVFKDRVYYEDLRKSLKPRVFDRQALLDKLAVLPDCQPRKLKIMAEENTVIPPEEFDKEQKKSRAVPKGDLPVLPLEEKYVYVRRLKDGALLDIPEKDLGATLARGGFEFVEKIELNPLPKLEPEDPTKPTILEPFQCPLCEFKGKNEKSLALHKRRKHA